MKKVVFSICCFLLGLTAFARAGFYTEPTTFYLPINWEGDISLYSDDIDPIIDITFEVRGYNNASPDTYRFIKPVTDSLISGIIVDDTPYKITIIGAPSIIGNSLIATIHTWGMYDEIHVTDNTTNTLISKYMFVPEPASMLILATGGVLALRRRR